MAAVRSRSKRRPPAPDQRRARTHCMAQPNVPPPRVAVVEQVAWVTTCAGKAGGADGGQLGASVTPPPCPPARSPTRPPARPPVHLWPAGDRARRRRSGRRGCLCTRGKAARGFCEDGSGGAERSGERCPPNSRGSRTRALQRQAAHGAPAVHVYRLDALLCRRRGGGRGAVSEDASSIHSVRRRPAGIWRDAGHLQEASPRGQPPAGSRPPPPPAPPPAYPPTQVRHQHVGGLHLRLLSLAKLREVDVGWGVVGQLCLGRGALPERATPPGPLPPVPRAS